MRSVFRRDALAFGAALIVSQAAGAAHARDALEITAMTLFSAREGVETSIVPVKQDGIVPYTVGDSCYGWYLEFEPVDGPVVLEEVLSIPAPAEQWNTDEGSIVADDRKSAHTTLTFDGREGKAQNIWCVVEGDPEGPYSFLVSEEGSPLGMLLRFRLERQ